MLKRRKPLNLCRHLPDQLLFSSEEPEADGGARGQSGEGSNLLRCLPPEHQLTAGGRRRQVGQSWTLESGEFYSPHSLRCSCEPPKDTLCELNVFSFVLLTIDIIVTY